MTRWKVRAILLAAAVPWACGDDSHGPEERFSVVVTPRADTLNAIGDTVRLSAAVLDEAGRIIPTAAVEWTSLDGGIATVDTAGRVIGLEEGLARIRARFDDAADTSTVLVRAGVPTGEMRFVKFSTAALDRVAREGSLWAVKGEDRQLVLRYQPEPGETEGEEFLELRVSAESLWKRPNGTTFAQGDSVLITVAVDDSTGFLFRFGPPGLLFDPERPARLEVTYRHADGDLNGDGSVDDEDRDLEGKLAVWKQEGPDQPWVRLFSAKFDDLDEIEALIYGFTGFALATN